jgi:hypothetical protein
LHLATDAWFHYPGDNLSSQVLVNCSLKARNAPFAVTLLGGSYNRLAAAFGVGLGVVTRQAGVAPHRGHADAAALTVACAGSGRGKAVPQYGHEVAVTPTGVSPQARQTCFEGSTAASALARGSSFRMRNAPALYIEQVLLMTRVTSMW